MKALCLALVACAIIAVDCFAEDWTVDGKTYHNVMVTDIDAARVSITFDDSNSQHAKTQIKVSELPPGRVAKLTADMQELKIEMALSIISDSSGPSSRYQRYEKERPDAVKTLRQHPLTMTGTVLYGNSYMYLVQFASTSKEGTVGTTPLETTEGKCFLLPSPNQTYTPKQQINLSVYPAGGAPMDGKSYPCYSNDPNWAYTMTHR